jgi:hypothetical protein
MFTSLSYQRKIYAITYYVSVAAVFLFLILLKSGYSEELILFDSHIHYNDTDRAYLSPKEILDNLNDSGIYGALVSSIPNDGTLMLYEEAPDRVVPFLRPYRTSSDKDTWYDDQSVIEYIDEDLKSGVYKGFGEVDLPPKHINAPAVKHLISLSLKRGLPMQIDSNEEVIEELFKLYPTIQIIWAHGGGAKPESMNRLLKSFPNLYIELAGRSDIEKNGVIDPNWYELIQDFPDRFLIGSGSKFKRTLWSFLRSFYHSKNPLRAFKNLRAMWVTSRWKSLENETNMIQDWLSQLPPNVAEKVAYKNAQNIFKHNFSNRN